jgi:manganese/zinc/iron transport system ATP- binding protein
LLKTLAGLQPYNAGTVSIYGRPVRACHHRVAYLPQRGEIDWRFPITVRRFVMTGRYVHLGWFTNPQRYDDTLVEQTLHRLGLGTVADRRISDLSGGQQQRALLARAIVQEAELLLLDEPFAALDAQTRVLMQELVVDLRRQGLCRSLLLVTHAIDEALLVGDRVVVLSARPGRIIADVTPQVSHSQSFDEIRAQPAFMQAFTTIWQLIRGEVEAQLREEVTL